MKKRKKGVLINTVYTDQSSDVVTRLRSCLLEAPRRQTIKYWSWSSFC